ncbi:MAG TPA: metallophosphoesterase [Pyrinomonadaceae bacterium]
MPDIRYVCLSDMHLGAQNSLLTNLTDDSRDTDPTAASPVLIHLVACLRELIAQNENGEKPTLILNGDVLELALTTENEAAMVFERFIELIWPEKGERLFKEILYIPGNHDHHLWETARETQYINYLSKKKEPGSLLDIPWHATSMFLPDPNPYAVSSIFLTGIIQRYPHLQQDQINTVYPNLALSTADRRKAVIFTHGHFTESMYMLMSNLRGLMFPASPKPTLTWDYEAENFAWIDFFWSTMGRSGDVGPDVEIIYDKLQDTDQLRKLIANLANGLAKKPNRASWKNWLETRMLRKVLNLILFAAKRAERNHPETLLSEDCVKGLKDYLEGPVMRQIQIERDRDIPPRLGFVFGHTHKPFEKDMDFRGYRPGVNVYNSGGWVVDTLNCQPLHGGAVILADENLNLASLRMYNEAEEPSGYSVKVAQASHERAVKNPFYERLAELIDPANDPWKTFSTVVSGAIPMRVENLKIKIAQWR